MKLTLLLAGVLCATVAVAQEGVDVGKPSAFRQLIPAQQIEQQSQQEYHQLLQQASAKKALASGSNPQLQRLRGIANRIIPQTPRFNPRASQWKWEVNLLGSKQVNAFCMPGGKIAFYSGLLDTLKLDDDEVAMVMGHEVAHALREHAREQAAKSGLTSLGASLLGQFVSGGRYADLFNIGGNLLNLSYSRSDESEADVVGLELAARAGFDPRAGVTLWQKMAAANNRAPLEWFSTHPSDTRRIDEIKRHLPEVMPLYERAKQAQR
ncbi:MAG TPA: M48 family metallopeptidase [Rhodocyclaceae bacterium]|nr:M48 family metallopeptidase [Rhodocyclaceae bacterium]